MEIAIVDDLQAERSTIRRIILEYFNNNKTLYGITPIFSEFENGESFLDTYHPDKYQLILLDIYMNKLTGIDVANRITTLDKKCNIIFFTNSEDHMLDGYDVHALGYVLKPVTNHISALYKAISHAMDRLSIDNSSVPVITEFGEHSIFYRNIIYLESSIRNLYVHFSSETIHISGRYSDYKNQLLKDNRFLECYRNLIVNMDYIDTPLEDELVLKNGEKIPISRRKKIEVMGKYMTYFIERRCV